MADDKLNQAESCFGVVELVADPEDCAWDQPCKYGHRVEHHAVYCHNHNWADSPRKCRRAKSWAFGQDMDTHRDCPGFEARK